MEDTNVSRVRDLLSNLKGLRVRKEKMEREIREVGTEAVQLLRVVDTGNNGVGFEYGDDLIAGYVQQNAAPDIVDQAGLVEALKRAGKFESVSTTVLDMQKLNAEIAAGNIRAQLVARYMSKGEAPAPYVRFAKPKKNSI